MKYLEGERPNKAGRIMLPDFKWCYKAIAIKTVGYWHKDRLTDQWKRTDSPEINPCIYMYQLLYDKGDRIYSVEITTPSINGVGETGQLHVKGWNLTTILQHTPKWTQMD